MFAKFVLIASLLCLSRSDDFKIKNCLGSTIWVGIQGNSGFPALNNGGFVLNNNQEVTVSSNGRWNGRIWARTGCSTSNNHCETGDCGNKLGCGGAGGQPPATWAEVNTNFNPSYYDISLVDGFNVPVSIKPIGANCRSVSCKGAINQDCPNELKVKNSSGKTIACKSACEAFHKEEYCCTGSHNTSATCPPTSYSKFFKQRCPDAYSYAYDDPSSTVTCDGNNYRIEFGC